MKAASDAHVFVEGGNVGWTTYLGRHGRLLQSQATLVTAHGQSPLGPTC